MNIPAQATVKTVHFKTRLTFFGRIDSDYEPPKGWKIAGVKNTAMMKDCETTDTIALFEITIWSWIRDHRT